MLSSGLDYFSWQMWISKDDKISRRFGWLGRGHFLFFLWSSLVGSLICPDRVGWSRYLFLGLVLSRIYIRWLGDLLGGLFILFLILNLLFDDCQLQSCLHLIYCFLQSLYFLSRYNSFRKLTIFIFRCLGFLSKFEDLVFLFKQNSLSFRIWWKLVSQYLLNYFLNLKFYC